MFLPFRCLFCIVRADVFTLFSLVHQTYSCRREMRANPCFCLLLNFCLSLFTIRAWMCMCVNLYIYRESHCIYATNGQKGSVNTKPLVRSTVYAYLMPLATLRCRFFCQNVKYQHFRVFLVLSPGFAFNKMTRWGKCGWRIEWQKQTAWPSTVIYNSTKWKEWENENVLICMVFGLHNNIPYIGM